MYLFDESINNQDGFVYPAKYTMQKIKMIDIWITVGLSALPALEALLVFFVTLRYFLLVN